MLNIVHKTMAHQLDKLVLYTMNRRVPSSLEQSYHNSPAFETVLALTAVNRSKTVEYSLSAPGEHPIWLDTMDGNGLLCRIRVRPAADPQAPLFIYHHGFSEMPYDNSWRRIFPKNKPFPAHTICIQAPYHDNWRNPFSQGFASIQHIYQMFAGSLRMIELVQNHFEAQGVPYTIIGGISWGGITSLLYEGLFQRTRAVVPMLSSPDLAQVMLDIADMFGRDITVPRRDLKQLLDFTPYYERCDFSRVYPLLGEIDQFFKYDHHCQTYSQCDLVTIPKGHITGYWRVAPLQTHIHKVLATVAAEYARIHPEVGPAGVVVPRVPQPLSA